MKKKVSHPRSSSKFNRKQRQKSIPLTHIYITEHCLCLEQTLQLQLDCITICLDLPHIHLEADLHVILMPSVTRKEYLNNDGHQFHGYQQHKQSHLISNHWTQIRIRHIALEVRFWPETGGSNECRYVVYTVGMYIWDI